MHREVLFFVTGKGRILTVWSFFAAVVLTNCCYAEVTFERVQLSDEFYSEGATSGDFNGDGEGDVAAGPWIYYGPDYQTRSRFYEGGVIDPVGYSENFLMYSGDVDGDQLQDIYVIGFPGKESWWFKNPGIADCKNLWTRHVMLDVVDNESPLVADIDGDNVADLICCSRGRYGYATHANQDPTQPWRFVTVSPDNGYQRFTHGLGIGDVDNDGDQDLLEKDGWWENPGREQTNQNWPQHAFAFSSGGSQMYCADLDGDGRNEVITGLIAHGFGLAYYKATNAEATQFERVDIMTNDPAGSPTGMAISQLHGVDIADLNGDTVPDIVTGKRWWAHKNKDDGSSMPCILAWFETQRKDGRIQFVPHVIDISSGVGCQIDAVDVNGDGLIDIVSGTKRGAYLFLQKTDGQRSAWVPGLAAQDPFHQSAATEVTPVNDVIGGFRSQMADGRILNFDFEAEGLLDWEIRGPIREKIIRESTEKQVGQNGLRYASTQPSGQAGAVGELISRPFQLHYGRVSFLTAGKDPEARVELVAENSGHVIASSQLVASEVSEESPLRRVELDVSNYVGQMVRLRLVDHSETASACLDDFRQHAR
ncbi:MAG: VCBS repeat-containing protein [Planctomycetales bacterium]|nr:VCBS repeat-containing protein [Planctomycetales bacterium]